MISQMKKIAILLMAFTWSSAFSQLDWELIHGTDSMKVFNSIFMTDTSHIWGAGEYQVCFSNDGGYQWEVQHFDQNHYFNDLFFLDNMTGWAIGWSIVLKTIDGGLNWILQSLPNPSGLDVEAVFFINSDTGWIAGSYQTIYRTYDGGENWTRQHDPQIAGNYWLYDIHFFDGLHGCAAGGTWDSPEHPIIFTTEDGGDNWIEIFPEGSGMIQGIQFVNELVVWACDNNGYLYRSIDAGFNWDVAQDLPMIYPEAMRFFNENDAVLGGGTRIAVTTDGWYDWEDVDLGGASNVIDFCFTDERKGVASGSGNIFKSADGGFTWKRVNDRFKQIAFFSQTNGWVIQYYPNRSLMNSTDGGLNWSEVDAGFSGKALKMSFPTGLSGFIMTNHFELLKTSDAGSTWEIIQLPVVSVPLTDMQFLDEYTGFICVGPNWLCKTTDGGLVWESKIIDTLDYITGVEFINSLEGWVIASEGMLAHTFDGGNTWTFSLLPVFSFSDIDFTDPLTGFIVSYSTGTAFRTTDGGITWQYLDLPLFAPEYLSFADAYHGWIADKYKLFYTSDGGDSWNEILDAHSANFMDEITDLFVLDSANAWICTLDGRVFSCSDLLEINENSPIPAIKLYPNPVKDQLNIELNGVNQNDYNLRIFSIDGKLMLSKYLKTNGLSQIITLDLSGYSNSIYFLNILGKDIYESFKIVKL
jgi:photosystem II stability/assembly factor-like uncharacterized protein